MAGPYLSIEVGKPANDQESAPRRNYRARKEVWSTPPGKPHVTTIHELFQEGMKEFSDQPCIGQRKFIKIHSEDKQITRKNGEKTTKTWQYYEMGPYEWQSYKEVGEIIGSYAAGLQHLGVEPSKSRMSIYCRTSREWMQTAMACASLGVTIVTAYDTLGAEGVRASLSETKCTAILCDKDHFGTLIKVLPETPNVKLVVFRQTDGEFNEKEQADFKKLEGIVETIIGFDDIVKLGRDHPVQHSPPKPTDIACIMYTSGSTGKPKGVVLNHETVVAGVTGAVGNVTREDVGPGDVFLNILPLAHIFEFTAELAVFYWGAALGYGNPKTVAEANMRNCKTDIAELKPTIMVAVPAVWEAVRKSVLLKIEKKSKFAQAIFWSVYNLKVKMRALGLPMLGVDNLIMSKIKEATGGRIRYTMNGGAALNRATRVFLDTCIAPCLMGYGLTETNAMCAISQTKHLDFDSTGELVCAVTVKFRDVPEANYYAQKGQGEVLIKGKCVSPGYFDNEEETKAAYTEDGWFQTGDIGEWTSNGALQIIDRKKNLIKTSNGEYIAIERLESLYRANKFVANICVFASSDYPKPVAVVVANEPAVKDVCGSMGVTYEENIAAFNKKVHDTIFKSLQQTGRDSDLNSAEILGGITISEEEWTPQNGFVTSAQKVQRRKIEEANKHGLAEAFDSI